MSTEKKPMELLRTELPQLEALLSLNALPGTDVKILVAQELEYLRMHALTKPEIMDCIPDTVVMAVKTVLKQNMTLDPEAGLVYVQTRNINVGGSWKKALEITKTANGIISFNRQCGRILDVKNPVVEKNTLGKVVKVSIEFLVPSVPSPRWDLREFDESDFEKWRRASHKQNARSWKQGDSRPAPNADTLNFANEHYTNWKGGIDPEFARAKAVRHGVKKLGTNPNEGRFMKIIVPTEKQVIIDPEKDSLANHEEIVSHEVVESTINETPKTEFGKAAMEL